MTAEDLKKSILQEAIQGKLVPQIASEGTGTELLEKILNEKSDLIKQGKLKKEKPLEPIKEDEISFDIPESWCWCRLGEIGDWKAGSTPARTNPDFYNGNIPWLKTGDLTDGYITEIPETITDLALSKCSMRLNPIGTVLIAMYGATIGKLGILKIPATTNQACCGCILYDGIDNKFLFYYLMNQKRFFTEKAEGGAQPNISREKIITHLFPLPPLAEQQRIVDAIEKFMPLVDEYGKREIKLNSLNEVIGEKTKKAILQEAISGVLTEGWRKNNKVSETGKDLLEKILKEKAELIKEGKIKKEKPLEPIKEDEIPFDIPEDWCWCRLGEICDKLVDGDHNPPAGCSNVTEYLMLSSRNINNDKLENLENLRYLTKDVFDKENERTFATEGDIFFTSVGTLGRSCIYSGEYNVCFQRSVSVLHTLIFNKYLKYYLDSPYYQYYVIEHSSGTAQKGFYLSEMAKSIIAIPPLEEQKQIVKTIEDLLPLCDKLGK